MKYTFVSTISIISGLVIITTTVFYHVIFHKVIDVSRIRSVRVATVWDNLNTQKREDTRIRSVKNARKTLPITKALILIQTAPKNIDLRNTIRQTWLQECQRKDKKVIACFFITDEPQLQKDNLTANNLKKEANIWKDIVIIKLEALTFGHRVLGQMQWAFKNYNFHYLTRVDDDVMICINHFVLNLATFPVNRMFQWGWLHCQEPGTTYIDEGITMWSWKLIRRFLSQNRNSIKCHKFGDQTIALWIDELKLDPKQLYFVDNNRIHHHPPASHSPQVMAATNVCNDFIVVHGLYNQDMYKLWWKRGNITRLKNKPDYKYIEHCANKPFYNWTSFEGIYGFKPTLCFGQKWTPFKFIGRNG